MNLQHSSPIHFLPDDNDATLTVPRCHGASAAAASEVVAPRGALPQGLPTPRGSETFGGPMEQFRNI